MPLAILIKARSRYLPWFILSHWGREEWNDQFQWTERSFAACSAYCNQWHYLQSNSKNVRMTSGRNNFKLHDLKLAFCSLEYFCIIVCQLHLNCKQLLKFHAWILVFHSQDRIKALDIEQKAKFGQKKLALNTSNKSLFLWVNSFCATGTVTILTVDFSRTN